MTEQRKVVSESRELTFDEDIRDPQRLEAILDQLVEQLCAGLVAQRRRGRTIGIKVRLDDFSTHTRARTLAEAVSSADRVGPVALDLLRRFSAPGRSGCSAFASPASSFRARCPTISSRSSYCGGGRGRTRVRTSAVEGKKQRRAAAINEAAIRDVNEGIERGQWPGTRTPVGFRCECARLGATGWSSSPFASTRRSARTRGGSSCYRVTSSGGRDRVATGPATSSWRSEIRPARSPSKPTPD